MNTQQVMEERLWEYIDGMAEAAEKSAIEQLIESNIEWRRKYHELLDVHQLMSSSLELDEPSMRFAQNVMEEIAIHKVVPSAQLFINKRIIWSIAAFFILSITGFLVYGLAQVSFSEGNQASSTKSSEAINDYATRFSSFEFGRLFSSTYTNICFMILVVLGLFLLDMFLNKKKKALRERLQH